jgi:hypothetical protein
MRDISHRRISGARLSGYPEGAGVPMLLSDYCNFFRLWDIVEKAVNPKSEIVTAEETE